MTLDKGIGGLLGDLRELAVLSGSAEAKQSIQGFVSAVESIWDLFKQGQNEQGCANLERLSDDFRDFERGKKTNVSFVAGPSGLKKN